MNSMKMVNRFICSVPSQAELLSGFWKVKINNRPPKGKTSTLCRMTFCSEKNKLKIHADFQDFYKEAHLPESGLMADGWKEQIYRCFVR